MLVLTRKLNQKIMIGSDIWVQVVQIDGHRIRLGIEAPDDVPVHREEVWVTIPELSGHLHTLHCPHCLAARAHHMRDENAICCACGNVTKLEDQE